MIPRAKIDALENAPPENIFNNPRIPSELWLLKASKFAGLGSIPGRMTNEPKR
jgi:hypothetical protein